MRVRSCLFNCLRIGSFDKKSLRDPNYNWPIKWLQSLARYPFEHDTWLGFPATIITPEEPPKRLAPNMKMTCLLLMVDTVVEPLRSMAGIKKGTKNPKWKPVHFYQIMPIYTEERNLERREGLQCLMDRLEEEFVGIVYEPNRINIGSTSD